MFAKAKAAQSAAAAAEAAAAAAASPPSSRPLKLDSHAYGSLIAACARGIKARSSDRKEQLVVLERAFQVRVRVAAGCDVDWGLG